MLLSVNGPWALNDLTRKYFSVSMAIVSDIIVVVVVVVVHWAVVVRYEKCFGSCWAGTKTKSKTWVQGQSGSFRWWKPAYITLLLFLELRWVCVCVCGIQCLEHQCAPTEGLSVNVGADGGRRGRSRVEVVCVCVGSHPAACDRSAKA